MDSHKLISLIFKIIHLLNQSSINDFSNLHGWELFKVLRIIKIVSAFQNFMVEKIKSIRSFIFAKRIIWIEHLVHSWCHARHWECKCEQKRSSCYFHRDYYLDKKRDNETIIKIIPCAIIKLHTINEWDKALRRRGQIWILRKASQGK